MWRNIGRKRRARRGACDEIPTETLPIGITVAGRMKKIGLAQDHVRPLSIESLAGTVNDKDTVVTRIQNIENIPYIIDKSTSWVFNIFRSGFIVMILSEIKLAQDFVRPKISYHPARWRLGSQESRKNQKKNKQQNENTKPILDV